LTGENKNGKKKHGKLKPKKYLMSLIIGFILALLVILSGCVTKADAIVLNKDTATLKVEETVTLSYTINPTETKDKTVVWESSNNTIATVSTNGTVTGVNEGSCVITVKTANSISDACSITIEAAGPDLATIYNTYCSDTWAVLASDDSYISIDTNPSDIEEFNYSTAFSAIEDVNRALGFSEAVLEAMYHTSSSDGKQSEEGDGIKAQWKYHPDKGLEIMYSLID